MTKAAQFLLVLTCLAPIAFVESAIALEHCQYLFAGLLFASVILLTLGCHWLLNGVRKISPVPKIVTDPSPKDAEALAFLVAYALPLVVTKTQRDSVYGLCAFTCIMGLVVWQQQVFHVNPMLALLGYHFFGVKSEGGAPALVIADRKVLDSGVLSVVQISEYVWLYCAHIPGKHGSTPDDSARPVDQAPEATEENRRPSFDKIQ
jgi:hypothetical protein